MTPKRPLEILMMKIRGNQEVRSKRLPHWGKLDAVVQDFLDVWGPAIGETPTNINAEEKIYSPWGGPNR